MVELFGGKKEDKVNLVDRVLGLQSKGLSNDQIVETLQHENHNSSEISEAIHQAELKKGVTGVALEKESAPAVPMAFGKTSSRTDRIHEIAEEIIDEKWDELVQNVNKIIDWKDRIDEFLEAMKAKIENLERDMAETKESVKEKLEQFHNMILDQGSDAKVAMKVLKEAMPELLNKAKGLGGENTLEEVEAEIVEKPKKVPKTSKKKPSKSDEIFGKEFSIEDAL